MLSVSTIWLALMFNLIAITVIWAHVIRSYPDFTAARYWGAAALLGCFGALVGTFRWFEPFWISMLSGGVSLVLASWVMFAGVRVYYGFSNGWRPALVTSVIAAAGMCLFLLYDSMPARIAFYSFGQFVPTFLAARLLIVHGRTSGVPGERLAGYLALSMSLIYVLRSAFAFAGIGGTISIVEFNGLQAILILLLVFHVMAFYSSLLLMAMARLRGEVVELALIDDLTGVANRRHLFQRLETECDKSMASGFPFSVLAIDLDGFKLINDRYGHAAGDESLRHFTLMVQSRLRPGDMLARIGGDEFFVVLPRATEDEAAVIAGRILEACRADANGCSETEVPLGASIGIAEWTPAIGGSSERMQNAADKAMYRAKEAGRNCFFRASELNKSAVESGLLERLGSV